MENVTLSEQEVKEQAIADEQAQQELRAEKESKRGKRIFADIVNRQEADAFSAIQDNEPTSKEPNTPKAGKQENTPASDSNSPETDTNSQTEADDSLAQEGGEDNDKSDKTKSESDPLLPESIAEKIKSELPDAEIDTPEQAQALIDKLIADSKNLEAERKAHENLYNLFENSNEMVDIARQMNQGRTFLEALARTVNIEEALADLKEAEPEQYKKVVRAQVEREKALEEQKKAQDQLEKQFEENSELSRKNIAHFEKSNELSPDASKDFLETVNQHFNDLVSGKVTTEFLEAVHKGLSYETAVEAAKEQGRIEGRNERINAEKAKKQGDNLPRIPRGQSRAKSGSEPEATRGKRALAKLAIQSQSEF